MTTEAVKHLLLPADRKGGGFLTMKRTAAGKIASYAFQSHLGRDHVHDIISGTDLLDHLFGVIHVIPLFYFLYISL